MVDRPSFQHDPPSVLDPTDPTDLTFRALALRQRRVALLLTGFMLALYFGFILLVAYAKPLLGRKLVPGLSLGILLGALVIVCAWLLTWVYVRWANTHYDSELERHRV
ncbi:MAG TPA: DUF485 domain-containing protein [Gemmatimonadales bacterium]|jgi:uncharacterized membrane protein (DUF485 family)|nr:DUF485 domain-containing protein [Gemmatimonadales bacterium]